jgi:DNA-binding transcriptional LysR family regulator
VLTGTDDMRRVRFFVELARDLHFGRSAKRQHVSQPTLSQQIKRFERDLGVVLFVRPGARGVTLTPAGARLLRDAEELLERLDRFNALAAEIADGSAPAAPAGRSGSGAHRRAGPEGAHAGAAR